MSNVRNSVHSAAEPLPSGIVKALPFVRDDNALVAGLKNGENWARAALFDRYAPHVERILRRILGHDIHTELADVIQDVFVQALSSIDSLRDGQALLAWMQTIAARTAYRTMRARRARRWLRFWDPTEVPDVQLTGADPDVLEAFRRTYLVLDKFPLEERMVFALRYIEGMELVRMVEILEVSLSTVKRRLTAAEERFARAAQGDEVLKEWLTTGGRWNP